MSTLELSPDSTDYVPRIGEKVAYFEKITCLVLRIYPETRRAKVKFSERIERIVPLKDLFPIPGI